MSNTRILYTHDYLDEIMQRLKNKKDILNLASIHRNTGVPRPVLNKFINGEIPNTSFTNIVKLYEYLEEQQI